MRIDSHYGPVARAYILFAEHHRMLPAKTFPGGNPLPQLQLHLLTFIQIMMEGSTTSPVMLLLLLLHWILHSDA